jgi:hypothetical protein
MIQAGAGLSLCQALKLVDLQRFASLRFVPGSWASYNVLLRRVLCQALELGRQRRLLCTRYSIQAGGGVSFCARHLIRREQGA